MVKDARSDPHGRDAVEPTDVPAAGWTDVIARTRVEMKADNVSLIAAGVAFYSLLALIPALAALVSIYGLIANPGDVARQVNDMLGGAPAEARALIQSQLASLTDAGGTSASIGALVGIVGALWSASAGMRHMMESVNLAYDEEESRGWIRLHLVSLALTVGAVLFIAVVFGAVALLPTLLDHTALSSTARLMVNIARWPVLFVGLLIGIAVLYRYAPDRDEPRWTWVSPGALAATTCWIIGSLLFSLYTASFAKYNETYGSLGAVVVMMMWLLLTAYVIIAGAELNAELERQTARDTTEGEPLPLGARRAQVADTIGATAEEVHGAHRGG